MQKRGFISPQDPQSWRGMRDPRGCDMARKATWQHHADPRAKVAQTRGKATRVHANARVAPCGSVKGLAGDGPMG